MQKFCLLLLVLLLPYSQKYWQEFNLVVEPKSLLPTILADLNLAVQYGIAIRIYVSKKYWQISIWRLHRQATKLPNLIPSQISSCTVVNFILVTKITN